MTPLYFRGCVLISERIISYREFLDMNYFDFKRLEALVAFKNKQINKKSKKQNTDEIKSQLNNVQSRNVSDMGFSEEQLKLMFD